jgi:hypothetical protein
MSEVKFLLLCLSFACFIVAAGQILVSAYYLRKAKKLLNQLKEERPCS